MGSLNDGAEWGTIVAGATSGLVVSGIVCRWAWNRFVRAVIATIRRIETKVTPNGGTTNDLGDRVQRIEDRQEQTEKLVRELHDHFLK